MPGSSNALGLVLPVGLIALIAIPVILWLHMRRRHLRRVTVPSITPWLALTQAVPPRRRRIPPSLLLAAHIAVATLIALALAQPTVPGLPGDLLDRAVLLDVTSSMASEGRWREATDRVREIHSATRGTFALITLGPRPRVVAVGGRDGAAIEDALAALEPGGTGANLDDALALAGAVAGPDAEVVVVTDGALAVPSTPAAVRWEVVGHPADNVAIVDAVARRTDATDAGLRLFARLANFTARDQVVPLTLRLDGAAHDARTIPLDAGGTFETVWQLPATAHTAELRIDTADALPDDDVALVPLDRVPLRVQMVGDSPAVARALAAMPDVSLTRAGLGNYRTDGSFDVTVFTGGAPDTLPLGGVIAFEPGPVPWLTPGTHRGTAEVALSGDHPVVRGLDLAGVRLTGLSDPIPPDWATTVLRAGDARAAIGGDLDGGRVMVFAFDPDGGDLSDRLAFPLLVARAVGWVAPGRPGAVVDPGAAVPLPPGEYSVRGPGATVSRAQTIFDETSRPGLYAIEPTGGRGGPALRFGVSSGDAFESDLARRTDLDGLAPAVGAATELGRRGVWPWLAAMALGLLLAESLWRGLGRPGAQRQRRAP